MTKRRSEQGEGEWKTEKKAKFQVPAQPIPRQNDGWQSQATGRPPVPQKQTCPPPHLLPFPNPCRQDVTWAAGQLPRAHAHHQGCSPAVGEYSPPYRCWQDRQCANVPVHPSRRQNDAEQHQGRSPAIMSHSTSDSEPAPQLINGYKPRDFSSVFKSSIPARTLLVVVDSNVFIQNLEYLKKLPGYSTPELSRIVLLVPWAVYTEVDAFKVKPNSKGQWLDKEATDAIGWIHRRVLCHDRNYVSLSAEEEKKSLCTIAGARSADDRILCCVEMWRLQLADIGSSAVLMLLSNDKHLRTRAMALPVHALSVQEFKAVLSANDGQSLKTPLRPASEQLIDEIARTEATRTCAKRSLPAMSENDKSVVVNKIDMTYTAHISWEIPHNICPSALSGARYEVSYHKQDARDAVSTVIVSGTTAEIHGLHSQTVYCVTVKCDLAPTWSSQGSVDTTNVGYN